VIGIIYLITNDINGHRYVGITTTSLKIRWRGHIRDSRRKQYPLYKAIRKYGLEHFKMVELEQVHSNSKDELLNLLDEKEVHHVSEQKSFIGWKCGGYNLTTGGSIQRISNESRKKQGDSLKRRYSEDPSHLRKMIESVKNAYVKDPSLRTESAERNRNRYRDPRFREMMGRKIKLGQSTPEVRKKMSDSHILLNRQRPELAVQHSLRVKGRHHPRFDEAEYTFHNDDGSTFVGTRFDFYNRYNLPGHKVTLLVHGNKKSYRGWRRII
jgi:group I intron endonuclease